MSIKIVLASLLIITITNGTCERANINDINREPTVSIVDAENKSKDRPILRQVGTNPNYVYDFVFLDGKIFGVGTGHGNRGEYLFTSSDGGKSWQKEVPVQLDEFTPLKGITLKKDKLWLIGDRGLILEKNDQEWKRKSDVPAVYTKLVGFADEQNGFVVAGTENFGCEIFRTEDSGKKWKQVYLNDIAGNPFDLLVIDKKTSLIAMNDEYILRTEDNGLTWTAVDLNSNQKPKITSDFIKQNNNGASNLELTDDGSIWVVGGKGSLYFSTDEGLSWKRPDKLPQNISALNFNSIAFSKNGKGVAVGEEGIIIFSKDNGKTWEELPADELNQVILKNLANNKLERLFRVRFDGDKAIILGRERGVYELRF